MVAALALDRFLATFKRFRRWIPLLEKVSGALLVALGILLLTGQFTILAAWLNQFTPEWLIERI
jgi:cytochrome c-type biogenesis protein